ncbi:hypothetical protein [Thalassotalea litorea]|uniref:hypothetical protein n=1 Tax=Thalassotalea litorea TaxID=2020715 RepID=UPI0037363E04
MKKILILIVAAAVYLHYYPSPQLNAWWEEQKTAIDNKFNDVMDTKARVSPSKLLSVMAGDLRKASKNERAYIEQLTESRDNIRNYYNEYCSTGKHNRRLSKNLQLNLCSNIEQHRLY